MVAANSRRKKSAKSEGDTPQAKSPKLHLAENMGCQAPTSVASSPASSGSKLCRHCGKERVNRPRGLGWSCYYTPGVRELYPSTSKYSRRGVPDFSGCAPLPDAPTTAVPGTREKVEVLVERAKASKVLHHPADARYAGDPRPAEWLARQVQTFEVGRAA